MMEVLKKENLMRYFDFVLLFLVGSVCLFYSFFKKFFAEIHIQLSFLDFPIFIGEIFLGVCLILSIIKFMIHLLYQIKIRYIGLVLFVVFFYILLKKYFAEVNIQLSFLDFPIFIGDIFWEATLFLIIIIFLPYHKIKIWYIGFVVYIIFMLGKAITGYLQYGPLAFRHAAMFYYPLFAVITYYAFRKDIFNPFVRIFLFILTLFILTFVYISFYLYVYFIIGLVLALTFKPKNFRYLSLVLVLFLCPYSSFFQIGRTFLVANVFTFMTLFVLFLIILKIKKAYKYLLLGLCFIIISIATVTLAAKGAIVSLISPQKIIEFDKEYDKSIKKKGNIFEFKKIEPKLYNPNVKIIGFTDSGDPIAEFQDQKVINPNLFQLIPKKPPRKLIKSLIAKLFIYALGFIFIKFLKSRHRKLLINCLSLLLCISLVIILIFAKKKFESEKGSTKIGTMIFRIYAAMDMTEQLLTERPILGFAFGKPFRSKRLEITNSAAGEWLRDGWVEPHNSYINIIYRSGIMGIILLVLLLYNLIKMTMLFLKAKSKIGVSLISTIFFWLVTAFFYVTFEMPYAAIPFWSSYGFILAYSHNVRKELGNINFSV